MATKQSITKSTAGAKARLKELTFDHDTAHLALCSKEQGAANRQEAAVVLKSKTFSPELIQKAQEVQVTMALPEFLRKFFGLYYDDAEVLARMMGYEPEEQEEYTDWIEERLKSFTILKSLHDAGDIASILQGLSEDDYSTVLDDALSVAKSIKEFESTEADNSTVKQVEKVEPVGSKIKKEKKVASPEMIEKSQYTLIEKQLDESKQELLKAREALAEVEKEKAQVIVKSRTDSLTAVLKDEAAVTTVMKAAGAIDAENFEALVTVFKGMREVEEKSELFKEIGHTAEVVDTPKGNALRDAINEKYHKKA